jgi:type VI secretion system protein ImpH
MSPVKQSIAPVRSPGAMRERLAEEGHRFDFYQAVRLLEMLEKVLRPNATLSLETVRFRSRVSLGFPASDIYEIRFPEDAAPEMIVNFMGLAGLLGPLPMPLTELVLSTPAIRTIDADGEPVHKPPAVVDFLDIFNHRLITLMYRVRQIHRPALTANPPSEGPVAQILFSLIGLGHPSLRGRMVDVRPGVRPEGLPDSALLFYSGILARRPRSVVGLQCMLADYFGIQVRIRQFIGRWRKLDPRQWTVLGGKHRRNIRLGQNVVIGTRVWDKQTHIRIKLGPLPRQKYFALLPGGSAHKALRNMIRFYLDPEFSFSLTLVLRKEDVIPSDLGAKELQLGFTSWLSPEDTPLTVDGIATDPSVTLAKDY